MPKKKTKPTEKETDELQSMENPKSSFKKHACEFKADDECEEELEEDGESLDDAEKQEFSEEDNEQL
jgi:hypothetical protein